MVMMVAEAGDQHEVKQIGRHDAKTRAEETFPQETADHTEGEHDIIGQFERHIDE